ncbi:hypothetical protein ACTMU2_24200 [Cupriavidus basilensis]
MVKPVKLRILNQQGKPGREPKIQVRDMMIYEIHCRHNDRDASRDLEELWRQADRGMQP